MKTREPYYHYKQSDLIALLLSAASMKDIGVRLFISDAQVQRAACAVYQRAKVAGRIEFMAAEIARLRERKDLAA